MSHELTPKQEAFCLKYIELGNATEAYYAAYAALGSKPITATRAAKQLLDNPKNAAPRRARRQLTTHRHHVPVPSRARPAVTGASCGAGLGNTATWDRDAELERRQASRTEPDRECERTSKMGWSQT